MSFQEQVWDLSESIFQIFLESAIDITATIVPTLAMLIRPIMPVIILLMIIIAIIFVINIIKNYYTYKYGAYYQMKKLSYLSVRRDIGKYGEYLTYKYLKKFESDGAKFLFNLYIPKSDEGTTEIDVLMLCCKGLFVFESKNYSGWIFGSEKQKTWCQTFPKGRNQSHKEYFYNPIMQNRSHIKHLKEFLGKNVPTRSIIVFSDRCTMKSILLESDNISVINRRDVGVVVSSIYNQISHSLLSENEIVSLYNKLYPYTQVKDAIKLKHISNIKNKENFAEHFKNGDRKHCITDEILPDVDYEADFSSNATSAETQQLRSSDSSKTKIQSLICPRCGGSLIERKANKGVYAGRKFYGCSNYPKCKYIRNIDK